VAYTIQKIGKSLVKYFKPVRVIPPHTPGDERAGPDVVSGNLDEESKKAFRLLKFKKPTHDRVAELKAALRSGESDEAAEEAAAAKDIANLPEQVPTQWIELVVFLLSACKRASHKIRKRIALESYRLAISSKNKTRVRTLGSIVNTTGATLPDRDDEEAA